MRNKDIQSLPQRREKTLEYRQTQVLFDKKWRRFLKSAWVFRFIPFVNGVFGNGSMAIGNVSEKSDFDVLILAKRGRIFTARAFSIIFFGLLGVRRSKHDSGPSAADKVCLNHFVSQDSFRLTEEVNGFWQLLYQKLVPVYGDTKVLESFFLANQDWLKAPQPSLDLRHQSKPATSFKRILQATLGGKPGDYLEAWLKRLQVKRIEAGLKKDLNRPSVIRVITHDKKISDGSYSLPPLIKYNDKELQFHPDPAIIEIKQI